MTFSVSYGTKRNLLLATTSLVVAHVRTFLQYHRYSWNSFFDFFASWLIHYVAIIIVIAISYGVIKAHEKYFLENTDINPRGLGVDEATVYICFTALVSALAIFFLAHLPADVMLDNY